MDVSDSDHYDSDEVNEAYEEAWGNLKDGSITCLNLEGTFRCFYSPSRKKRTYKYTQILQHAEAVSKGSRGPGMAGKHVALKEYLEKDMAEKAPSLVQRQFHIMHQDVAPRVIARPSTSESTLGWAYCKTSRKVQVSLHELVYAL